MRECVWGSNKLAGCSDNATPRRDGVRSGTGPWYAGNPCLAISRVWGRPPKPSSRRIPLALTVLPRTKTSIVWRDTRFFSVEETGRFYQKRVYRTFYCWPVLFLLCVKRVTILCIDGLAHGQPRRGRSGRQGSPPNPRNIEN